MVNAYNQEIESCTVLQCRGSSLWSRFYSNQPTAVLIILVLAFVWFSSLAALTKATTYPAYAFLAGLLVLAEGFAEFRRGGSARAAAALWLRRCSAFRPAPAGAVWAWYTDFIKPRNPLGELLTSSHLAEWNYGTWHQRVSGDFWRGAILYRALPDIFGYDFIGRRRRSFVIADPEVRAPSVAALVGFVLPFLLFTNLHLIHSYYQTANAPCALALVFGIATTC